MSILRALQMMIILQWLLVNISDAVLAEYTHSCSKIAVSEKSTFFPRPPFDDDNYEERRYAPILCDGQKVATLKAGEQVRVNTEPTREFTYKGIEGPKDHPWVTNGDLLADGDLLAARCNEVPTGGKITIYQGMGNGGRQGFQIITTITKKAAGSKANWLNAGDYYQGSAYAYDDDAWAYADEDAAYDEYDAEEAYDEMMVKLYMKGYKAGLRAAKQEKLSRLLQ
mmetsp:Transcript_39118/g.63978  ORF Transcript_39118/g.63978 Transcript_39118/m.63978 type:complete len:225 (-) Transcript_39118:391-1065(-)|eukprot:CAMPEP_0202704728 /NCGR_PEP_ID=MMETSP1385-20130828/17369_1 /ASSEMBLY_ACC=CAM_ASM_000861 /TAXON_ID=933848 /ORGANISM="Elphidium margaritaceum" /LENGTH=224 /DNA_ID=CAMNT_0049362817 /DNA_START=48 /DNA_END=722 /DNA_ORIENTATION=-